MVRCCVCLKNAACPEEGIDSASETPVKKESTCSTVGKKMDSLRSGDRSDLGWVPVGSEVTAVSFRCVPSFHRVANISTRGSRNVTLLTGSSSDSSTQHSTGIGSTIALQSGVSQISLIHDVPIPHNTFTIARNVESGNAMALESNKNPIVTMQSIELFVFFVLEECALQFLACAGLRNLSMQNLLWGERVACAEFKLHTTCSIDSIRWYVQGAQVGIRKSTFLFYFPVALPDFLRDPSKTLLESFV